MITIAALLLGAQAFSIEKPDLIKLRPSAPGRAIDEFEAICLAPMFDRDKTAAAVRKSTIAYKADPVEATDSTAVQRWRAPNAIATLILPTDPRYRGFAMPQCEVAMGESEARAPRDILESLLPRLKRYVRTDITFDPKRTGTLNWTDKSSGEIYELDLESPNEGKLTQSRNFVLTVFTQEGRRVIEAAIKQAETNKETSAP